MKVVGSEWWSKVCKCYLDNWSYMPNNDPEITYQEYILICGLRMHATSYEMIDLDELARYTGDEVWKENYLAQYFQPEIIDKPWDQVLVKRNVIKNTFVKKNHHRALWKDMKKYKDLKDRWIKEDAERKEQFRQALLEDEKRCEKQREYQRKRREKIKLEKGKING